MPPTPPRGGWFGPEALQAARGATAQLPAAAPAPATPTPPPEAGAGEPEGGWFGPQALAAARAAGSYGAETLSNVPGSAANYLVSGMAAPILHPVDTVQGMYGLASGLVQKFVPGEQDNEDFVNAAASIFAERYGTPARFAETFKNDPVGTTMAFTGRRFWGDVRTVARRVRADREAEASEERSTLNEAAHNFLPSLWNLAVDITAPFHSPIDTGKSLIDLTGGILGNLAAAAGIEGGPAAWTNQRQVASAVGQALIDRYGSMEGIRNTIRNDPAGILADVAGLVSGGSTLALKAPGAAAKLAQLGGRMRQASSAGIKAGAQAAEAAQAAGRVPTPGQAAARTAEGFRAVAEAGSELAADAARTTASGGRGVVNRVADAMEGAGKEGAMFAPTVRAAAGVPGEPGLVSRAASAIARNAPAAAGATLRGVRATAQAVDPARHIARGTTGALRLGGGMLGAGIARGLAASTGTNVEDVYKVWQASRDNARRATAEDVAAGRAQTVGESIRALPGEEGSKKIVRDAITRRVSPDQVVEDVRGAVGDIGARVGSRAIEQLGAEGPRLPERPAVDKSIIAAARTVQEAGGSAEEAARAARLRAAELAGELRKKQDEARANRAEADRRARDNSLSADERRQAQKDSAAYQREIEGLRVQGGKVAAGLDDALDAHRLFRADPHLAAYLQGTWDDRARAADVADARSEAAKRGVVTRQKNRQAEQLVSSVRRFFGAEPDIDPKTGKPTWKSPDYGDTTDKVRGIMDAARAAGELYDTVIDSAVKFGKLTQDELSDLLALRRVVKPTLRAKAAVSGRLLGAAGGIVGSAAAAVAKPALKTAIASMAGAALAGSGWARRRMLDLVKKQVLKTGTAGAVLEAGRHGFKGAAAARAGGRAVAESRIFGSIPTMTLWDAVANAGQWGFGKITGRGGGKLISRQTRDAILGNLVATGDTALTRTTDAAYAGLEKMFGRKLEAGEKAIVDKMLERVNRDAATGELKGGSALDVERLRRMERQKINMNRVSLAVERAISRAFRGVDLDPHSTANIRATVGSWLNEIEGPSEGWRAGKSYSGTGARARGALDRGLDRPSGTPQKAPPEDVTFAKPFDRPTQTRGDSLHNVAGAEVLLANFENAIQAPAGGGVTFTSPQRRVLQAGYEAARAEIMKQATPEYRGLLEDRRKDRQFFSDLAKAFSTSEGQSAEVVLRKILETRDTHADSRHDKRLRRMQRQLLEAERPELGIRLAGMSFDRLRPSGATQRTVGLLTGGAALASGVNPLAAVLAASASSPLVVGLTTSAAGGVAGSRPARLMKKLAQPENAQIANQLGRVSQLSQQGDFEGALSILSSMLSAGKTAAEFAEPAVMGLARLMASAWGAADAGVSYAVGDPQQLPDSPIRRPPSRGLPYTPPSMRRHDYAPYGPDVMPGL